MKILFIVPYPLGQAPSQRFRFEQYLVFLTDNGHIWHIAPFVSAATWAILYKPGHALAKMIGVVKGFLRRFVLLFSVQAYDYIFIHREASPIGPPLFEWIIVRILKKKVIYDFDDAIWIANTSEANKLVARIKYHDKIKSICKWSYKISCGNTYLCNYAQQFNHNVVVNPTTIDTVHLHNQIKDQSQSKRIVIGWTGTHSTLKYIKQVIPILNKLEQEFDFEFCVISNEPPDLSLKSLRYQPWRKETEINDLLQFNIGLMPLENDPWAKGKCAFKALQYMALGIPALVSPVGMNTEVVTNGVNGYVCSTLSDWETSLRSLLQDNALRTRLGQAARITVEEHYSVTVNRRTFLDLFT